MNCLQLRSLMRRYQISQVELATMAGVSVATVRAWLRSARSKAHRRITPERQATIERKLMERMQAQNPHTHGDPFASTGGDGLSTGESA